MEFCSFINVCYRFWPITFWGSFLYFFLRIRTKHRFFSIIMMHAHIKFLETKFGFFQHFSTNVYLTKRLKKLKPILQMCLRIPFYIHFRSARLNFVKKVKIVYLLYSVSNRRWNSSIWHIFTQSQQTCPETFSYNTTVCFILFCMYKIPSGIV